MDISNICQKNCSRQRARRMFDPVGGYRNCQWGMMESGEAGRRGQRLMTIQDSKDPTKLNFLNTPPSQLACCTYTYAGGGG